MTKQYDPNVPSEFDSLINTAAAEHGINAGAFRKQLWLESRFKPDAQSPTGPKGIAQFTKQTAGAYGLSDDDRLNPQLAINAAARHMADLTKKFGGDELKAALAYNVGEGPKGAPQLAAYDRGDFSAINAEGLNYMRTMSDSVAQNDKVTALASFGGITPKGKGIPAEDAFAGISKTSKVTNALPESTGFNVGGVAQAAPEEPFGKAAHYATPEDKGLLSNVWSATKDTWKTSTLGTVGQDLSSDNAMSMLQAHFTPNRWNSHEWTPEELARIRSEVKDPRYINSVLGGDAETLDALIVRANQNAEADARVSQTGTAGMITSMLAGAAFDPVTYIPVAGPAAKAGILAKATYRGAQAAGLNMLSEGVRTSVAGGDADYAGAALGGLVLGSGLSVLGDSVSKLRANRKAAGVVDAEPASSVDPVQSTDVRLRSRLKAQATSEAADFADPSVMPLRPDELVHSAPNGVPYAEAPNVSSTGNVRLASGDILAGSNPVNPRTLGSLEEVTKIERAARGLSTGSATFDEVGQTILRAESDAVRSLGLDLVRAPVGLESGASGKYAATASDIVERMRYLDHQFFSNMDDLTKKAINENGYSWYREGLNRADHVQAVSRRVAEAVEDLSGSKVKSLSPSEKALVDLIKEHHQFKADSLRNPASFGNAVDNAKGMLGASHFDGHYYPVRYSASARSVALSRFGGSVQELKGAIKASYLNSYRASPEVKARVDAYLTRTGETLEDYAERKAFGVANASDDAVALYHNSGALEDVVSDSSKLAGNDYLKERHLFANDFEVTLPDGSKFSPNDLRAFTMEEVLPSYNRRINGDIAILGGTGRTTDELVKAIDAIPPDAKGKAELLEVVKVLTGRARKDPEGALGTLARSLSDLAYASKNTFMGPQNYTEIASMVTRGGIDSLGRAVPALGRFMKKRGKLNAKEANEVHGLLFGKELDDSIMPSRNDIVERLRGVASGSVANIVGSVKWATGYMAQRLPMSRVMTSTVNHIVRAARIETLGNLAHEVHLGGKAAIDSRLLKSAAISPEQYKGIKSLMQEHTYRDAKTGEYRFKDAAAMKLDPRTMDLWRLADHVASETMLRTDKVSLQAGKQLGGVGGMAMQFKTFVLRSVNGRLVKRFYESTKNGRALDQSMTIAVELMLAGGFAALRAQSVAMSMQAGDRKRYLDKALDPNVLAIGAVTRSATLGAPLGVYGFLAGPLGLPGADLVQSYRTTMNPKAPMEKNARTVKAGATDYVSGVIDRSIEQVPGLQLARDISATIENAAKGAMSPHKADAMAANDAAYRSLSRVVPNDPVTQWLLLQHFESNVGIYQDQQRTRK